MMKHRDCWIVALALMFIAASRQQPTGPTASPASQPAQQTVAPSQGVPTMTTVRVRYIVHDVEAAIAFYTNRLGFEIELQAAPGFAQLSRGSLRLLLNKPGAGGAGQAMPDGRKPEPGGWNRIQIEVPDLAQEVERLRKAGAHFRNDIVTGQGGKQILLDDPSGNCIELFEPPAKKAQP